MLERFIIILFIVFGLDVNAQSVYFLEYPVYYIDSTYIHEISLDNCDTINTFFYNSSSIANFAVNPINKSVYIASHSDSDSSFVLHLDFVANTLDTVYSTEGIKFDPWSMEFLCPNVLLIQGRDNLIYLINVVTREVETRVDNTPFYSYTNCSGELWYYYRWDFSKAYKINKSSWAIIDSIDLELNFNVNIDCFRNCSNYSLIGTNNVYPADSLKQYEIDEGTHLKYSCPFTTESTHGWPHIFDFPYYNINIDLDTTTTYCQDNNAMIEYDCNQDSIFLTDLLVDYFNNYHELDSMVVTINNPVEGFHLYIDSGLSVNVEQSNKDQIRLYNNGSSKDEDFSDALRTIIFYDSRPLPHFETYEIEVQIFECGAESTPATLFLVPSSYEIAGEDNSVALCYDDAPIDLNEYLSIQDPSIGYWDYGNGLFDPALDSSGVFNFIVDNGSCGIDTASITIDMIQPPERLCRDTIICMADSVYFNGNWITDAGQFFDTVRYSRTGCDSLILELEVAKASEVIYTVEQHTLCFGNAIEINGLTIINDTIMMDTLIASYSACDSVYVEYQVSFTEAEISYVTDTLICYGDTVNWMGNVLINSGSYEESVSGASGCDSLIHMLNLTIEEVPQLDSVNYILCSGDSIMLEGEWVYSDTTIINSVSHAFNSCDSLLIREDYIFSSVKKADVDSVVVCQNVTYQWYDRLITEEGTYRDTIQGSIGCDSLIKTLFLAYHPEVALKEEEKALCYGEVVYFNGIIISGDTIVYDTIQYQKSDCDSVINIFNYVEQAEAQSILIDTLICAEDDLQIFGIDIENEGLTQLHLQSGNECDSLNVMINVQYIPPAKIETIDTILCDGDSLYYSGVWLTHETASITQVPYFDKNCDSLISELYLDFNEPIVLLSETSYTVEANTDTQLSFEFSSVPSEVSWQPSLGLSCVDCLSPVVNIGASMEYMLGVSDSDGCSSEWTIIVEVRADENKNSYYVPNIINVNDPHNNRLFVQSPADQIIDYRLSVYDRWGNPVFISSAIESNDPESGWDGTSDATLLQGVYVYMIEFVETKERIVGDITVLK